MKTFKFNYQLLFLLGNNLHLNANSTEKLYCNLKNIAMISFNIFIAIIPTIAYMIEYQNDTAAFIVAAFQLPAIIGTFLIYICLIFYKTQVNEIFRDIEEIVDCRMRKCQNDLYEQAIKSADFCTKFPIYFIFGIFVTNNLISSMLSITFDLINGEIDTTKWYLPLRWKYVSYLSFELSSRNSDIFFYLKISLE